MYRKPLIIIDSNYICYVHRFALSAGLSYKGGRTEIIYGFLNSLLEVAKRYETNRIAFAWDSKTKHSKRRALYPEYKMPREIAKQKLTEEELEQDQIAFTQFNQLRKEVLPAIGFKNIFYKKGYEGDDIIASLVYSENHKRKCIVISNDEDLFQLLDYCIIYNIRTHTTMTDRIFSKIYGISPLQWVTVKQLAGCTSDNVKGLPGIGKNRAIDYIKGNLKGAYLKIIDDDKNKIYLRNLPLVQLPFEGTGIFPTVRDTLKIRNFKAVCKDFGFSSFLKEENLKNWITTFDME